MRKLLFLTLGALLLLSTSATPSAPARSPYTTRFCPECWMYLVGPGDLTMKGDCASCGKYPLDLEVRTLQWFWCQTQHLWLKDACKENPLRRCCRPEESIAMQARPGPGLVRAFYCPEHRSFTTGVRLPLIQVLVCARCTKPMVSAWAADRAWYWCAMEGVWAATPCPMDPVKHCCAKREGRLLATPEPGPFARR